MGEKNEAPVPFASAEGRREVMSEFRQKNAVGATKVTVWEYDWTRPIEPKNEAKLESPGGFEREVFHHSMGVEVGGYDEGSKANTEDYTAEQALHLKEQAQVGRNAFGGGGNVITLEAGGRFALAADPNAEYACLAAEHHGTAPIAAHSDPGGTRPSGAEEPGGGDGYRNRFECIPMGVTVRDDVRAPPRPRNGVYLATVVGPDSEDVECDYYGQVRIRFHFDRESEEVNSKRQCWARVAQSWAGRACGTLFIPRIGMEVAVQFIEGDPDRPIVIGCLYNNWNTPPVSLPKDKTKSGIYTVMSPRKPSELGQNILQFEDWKGHEEIYIQAQKDLKELVKHDLAVTVNNNEQREVQADQSLTVKGNRSKAIEKNEDITVKGNRGTTVSKDESLTVEGSRSASVTGADSLAVEKDRDVAVKGNLSTSIEKGESRAIAKSRSTSIQESDTLQVKKKLELTADEAMKLAQGNTSLSFAQSKVNLDAGGAITITQGSVTVTIKDGNVSIKASEGVTIERGGSKIRVGSSSVGIKGSSKVKIQ
jgi:type VI secretion system secreted protein VgrG